jgi:hypothetical protein
VPEFGTVISATILDIAIIGIIVVIIKFNGLVLCKSGRSIFFRSFFSGTSHRYLFFDLDDLFFCLFSFRIIITATPHNRSAKSLCCRNHVIPPAIAKIIPKIPIGCSLPTNVVTPD